MSETKDGIELTELQPTRPSDLQVSSKGTLESPQADQEDVFRANETDEPELRFVKEQGVWGRNMQQTINAWLADPSITSLASASVNQTSAMEGLKVEIDRTVTWASGLINFPSPRSFSGSESQLSARMGFQARLNHFVLAASQVDMDSCSEEQRSGVESFLGEASQRSKDNYAKLADIFGLPSGESILWRGLDFVS